MRCTTSLWVVLMQVLFYDSSLSSSRSSRFIISSSQRIGICEVDTHLQHEHVASVAACGVICISDSVCASYSYSCLTKQCRIHERWPQTDSSCVGGESFLYYKRRDSPLMSECRLHANYTYSQVDICYKLHNTKVNWLEARANCLAEGGELMKLDTEMKRQFLRGIIQELSGLNTEDGDRICDEEYFVGGQRVDNTDQWIWVYDNSTVANFSMYDEEANCLEMECFCDNSILPLDDTSCHTEYQIYFCEVLV